LQSPVVLTGAQSDESYISESLSFLDSLLAFFGGTDENDLEILSFIFEYGFVSFLELLTLELAAPGDLVGEYDEIRTHRLRQFAMRF